jgi:hypothetical protein
MLITCSNAMAGPGETFKAPKTSRTTFGPLPPDADLSDAQSAIALWESDKSAEDEP